MDENVLFVTIVGSHVWNMNTPESDTDYMIVFQQPTYDILSGRALEMNRPQKKYVDTENRDLQYMEIGHLVNLLIKGNVNAIWAVTTPIITQDSPVLRDLRDITIKNLSRMSYASIRGMAISQYNDNEKRPKMPSNKAYKTCLRTLNFGVTLFDTGKIVFAPVTHVVGQTEILERFDDLSDAYERTTLPERPNEQEFRNFLYDLRVWEL